jgi:hypothetical protein
VEFACDPLNREQDGANLDLGSLEARLLMKLRSVRHMATGVIALAALGGCTMLLSAVAKADVIVSASSFDAGLGQTNTNTLISDLRFPAPLFSPVSVSAAAPDGGNASASWDPRVLPTVRLEVNAVGGFTDPAAPEMGTIGNHGGSSITVDDSVNVNGGSNFTSLPFVSSGNTTIGWNIYFNFPTPTLPGQGLTISGAWRPNFHA